MTENNVTTLHGGNGGQRKPDAAWVALLERELDKARSGETIGGVVASVLHNEMASWRTAGFYVGMGLLGALQHAAHDICTGLDADVETTKPE